MASEPLKHTRSGSMVQNVAGLWSGAGSTRCMDISSNTPKVHGRVLRANPVTISHFLCVPYYYWDVGRPGLVSDPGPDLSTKWISPQIHKKYTGVYFELIRSLLATFYASLTIIGASDVRDWYLIRGRICPPNGYLLKYTKSTRAYTLS